jgi:hypothetical protein
MKASLNKSRTFVSSPSLSFHTIYFSFSFHLFFHSNMCGKRFFRNFNIYKSLSTNCTRNELGTEETIETDLKEKGLESVDILSGSGLGPVAGSCEYDNDYSGYIKSGEMIE